MALLGCRQGQQIRIDFVALPEMLRVKRCWVASGFDLATERDDNYAVVVDLETMLCFSRRCCVSQGKALHPEDAKSGV